MVDRAVPLATVYVDIPIKADDGSTFAVWRRPLSYPSGPLSADPGRFGDVDPRSAVCHILTGPGARYCFGGRGYF